MQVGEVEAVVCCVRLLCDKERAGLGNGEGRARSRATSLFLLGTIFATGGLPSVFLLSPANLFELH